MTSSFIRIAFLLLVFQACIPKSEPSAGIKISKKIRGACLSLSDERMDITQIIEIHNANINYIQLRHFADVNDITGKIQGPDEDERRGNTLRRFQECMDMAKEKKITAMLMPMLQPLPEGGISSRPDRKLLEDGYREHILLFAELSEKNRLPLFCIGAQQDDWVMENPEYWRSLIREVRKVYHGDLIYAADWKRAKQIPVWPELAYIGVNFYAPVSRERTPSPDTLDFHWRKWKEELSYLSDSLKKEIIFTEWGYADVDHCGVGEIDQNLVFGKENQEAQRNCYEALVRHCYGEKWFMGGFVWAWISGSTYSDRRMEAFSPQEKPAQEVLQKIGK